MNLSSLCLNLQEFTTLIVLLTVRDMHGLVDMLVLRSASHSGYPFVERIRHKIFPTSSKQMLRDITWYLGK